MVYTVAAFYNFVKVTNPEETKSLLLPFLQNNQIVGTAILASEGINGTVCGSREAIDNLINFFKTNGLWDGMEYKEHTSPVAVFDKTKVKIKKEIVTFDTSIDPTKDKGEYIAAKDWDDFVLNSNATIVDTRNTYEVECGTFKNSIDPKTTNFIEFKEFVQNNLMDKKEDPVGMFCTGGVRCEKSTAYLKALGFKKVYHLKGGILRYMQEVGKEGKSWEGECFVFDHRRSVGY